MAEAVNTVLKTRTTFEYLYIVHEHAPEFITSDKTAVGEVGQKLEGQEILEEAEKEDRGSSAVRPRPSVRTALHITLKGRCGYNSCENSRRSAT